MADGMVGQSDAPRTSVVARDRKWKLTWAVMAVTVLLAMFDKMTTDVATIFTGLIVSFNGANAAVHWAREKRNG